MNTWGLRGSSAGDIRKLWGFAYDICFLVLLEFPSGFPGFITHHTHIVSMCIQGWQGYWAVACMQRMLLKLGWRVAPVCSRSFAACSIGKASGKVQVSDWTNRIESCLGLCVLFGRFCWLVGS
jgi:hypothetical protein